LRIKFEFKLFDGLTVITNELQDFFQKDLSLNLKIIVVPILINIPSSRITNFKAENDKSSLVYTGSLINHKDGILTIIESFANVLQDYQDLQLIMTGDINTSPDKEPILHLIDDLNIKDKIKFTGFVSKKELEKITTSATLLLLAKPDFRQNRYNMATKIGEYLLTGRPVILSSVDPACNYLEHRKNALIAEPEIQSFTSEIKYALDNPVLATQIGMQGKEIALKSFDSKFHTKRINNFLKTLI
jgi:glycosyltransferase involved in cell wall biosynthesis